jgi:hypothetical protein
MARLRFTIEQQKGPLASSALAGLFESLSSVSLVRHTGHSRQHARRMVVVVAVVVQANAHYY